MISPHAHRYQDAPSTIQTYLTHGYQLSPVQLQQTHYYLILQLEVPPHTANTVTVNKTKNSLFIKTPQTLVIAITLAQFY